MKRSSAGEGSGATGALVISISGSVVTGASVVTVGSAVVRDAVGSSVVLTSVGAGELVGKGVVGSGLGTILG